MILIAIKASLSCTRARSKVSVMTPRSRSQPWGQDCELEVKFMTLKPNMIRAKDYSTKQKNNDLLVFEP